MTIDASERPDLRNDLAASRLTSWTCSVCGHHVGRQCGLFLTRLHERAPLIVAIPDDYVGDDPLADLADIAEETRARLGTHLLEVPAPALVIPFDVCEQAAGRDISLDLRSLEAGASYDDVAGERYGWLLRGIVESEDERSVDRALLALSSSLGEKAALDRVASTCHPKIAEEVAAALERRTDGAATAEERDHHRLGLDVWRWIAAGDVDRAWSTAQDGLVAYFAAHLEERIRALLHKVDESRRLDDRAELIAAAQQVLDGLPGGMEPELEAEMSFEVAVGTLVGNDVDAAQVETVLPLLHRTLHLLDTHPEIDDPHRRVAVLNNLAAAYARRHKGDPSANLNRAERWLRDAVSLLEVEKCDPDALAMARTNLGLALLERDGDIVEATQLLEAALAYRTIDRDAEGNTYTNINLAGAYRRLATALDRKPLLRAVACCRTAAQGAENAGRAELAALALHNLSHFLCDLADYEPAGSAASRDLLEEAERRARESLALRRPPEVSERGRTRSQLATTLARLDRAEDAAVEFSVALADLGNGGDALAERDTAVWFAGLLQHLGRHAEAADVYDVAVKAAVRAIDRRAAADSRLAVLSETTTVFRFAAYALASAGRTERAVKVIESGRGRELALALERTSIDITALQHLNPNLADRLTAARLEVERIDAARRRGEGVDDETADRAVERFRSVLSEVQQEPLPPGADESSMSAVATAATSDVPIAYLVAAPGGSVALVVDAAARVTAIRTEALTSASVAEAMGGDWDTSYLRGQAEDASLITPALEKLQQVVGNDLLRPLARQLAQMGASGVCLIPTGLLGLLPLHGLQWEDGDALACLLDRFEVVYSPSARVRRFALERTEALEPGRPRLLSVGNPLPTGQPLPGAETEVAAIEATFDGTTVSFVGYEATRQRVLDELDEASHIHFACHGSAGFFSDPFSAFLALGDGRLTAAEIISLKLQARLVVASACQTGVAEGYEVVDEALSISTAFLAAGTGGVVSSLWSVDDFATQVTMTRFYELMADGETPVAALRTVQRWLRTLTTDEIDRYVDSREALRDSSARLWGTRKKGANRPMDHPWAAYEYWAAFTLTGA